MASASESKNSDDDARTGSLPEYVVDLAKSNRSSCCKCSAKIGQGSLRIGRLAFSPSFDGKIPRWHHKRCIIPKIEHTLLSPLQVKGLWSMRPDVLKDLLDLLLEPGVLAQVPHRAESIVSGDGSPAVSACTVSLAANPLPLSSS